MAHKFENHVIQKHHILVEVVVETTANRNEAFKAIERGIFRGLDTPPTMIAAPSEVSVNNINMEEGYHCISPDWLETYTQIALEVGSRWNEPSSLIDEYVEDAGRFAIHQMIFDLTEEFEQENKGRQWDGEWLEAIDSFLNSKLK